MTAEPVRLDRRHRRRQETIEQIVDVAIDVMAETGAGGLSLGEVARRVGIRTPSLYVYFDSKHALYDAVFAGGWRELDSHLRAVYEGLRQSTDLREVLLGMATSIVRWALEHPGQSQLMMWRPVPGYEPSPAAYAPAIDVLGQGRANFAGLQARGLFPTGADVDELLRVWTVLTSGVMSQQMANAPHEPFDKGTFTGTLPTLVDMYVTQYAPPPPPALSASSPRRSSP